ncbi:uncharacterized protein LACBIDRAFT_314112 [Laccaria bicolor S238N-H82]|uniref:Predicted protein n=1 Tax=Laccaria bicolor (strain S238N-H82 / ATCC MYA-4686) TaxID=486041 RepID=B0D1M0_LACBS|nr:uncharacterized protein LACBIDRAFT_314112 [Laccaria bicolor S238N-H82]EDR11664.1 predicted protein [Laccaria bicolor S238N-H82]|eukprot:XP_001877561.1 predicted protein [Laccaria bicolor S238N-H82]
MSIPGLWKLLSGIRKDQSLTELAVCEGFEIQQHSSGVLIVGIDASPWMYAVQASMDHAWRKGASRAALGKNSEL